MASGPLEIGQHVIIARGDFHRLIDALRAGGYQVIGPTVRDGAIVYAEPTSADQPPIGWTDIQEAGSYRLQKRSDDAFFGYVVGPHSWKQFLCPAVITLWRARREGGGFTVVSETDDSPPMAFIGVRACELAAITIQDQIFLQGPHVDPIYRKRREQIFIVAVNCTQAGGTCFCASMQTGPKATVGFDLALTELLDADRHEFVAEVGSARGAAILAQVPHRPASGDQITAAEDKIADTTRRMGRVLETDGIKELLYRNINHPRWDQAATRCLTCGNCTMVCPTCFCTTVEDTTDLSGEWAERQRRWDSCFTLDFSFIHGGPIRSSARSRFRQWMTHKLAAWIDQFGRSGCVGCGRCITWCPVGIDITAEAAAIRASESEPHPVAVAKESVYGNA
jgi:sulfhydrogenase subunit beta (sulfur reductase)